MVRMHAATAIRTTLLALMLVTASARASASAGIAGQGITTATVRGALRGTADTLREGIQVEIRNEATGVRSVTVTRGGRFLIVGLEVGGPYRLWVRRIGVAPVEVALGMLALGEVRDVVIPLETGAVQLAPVIARTTGDVNAHGGTASRIPERALRKLPTIDRNQYDLVRLVPQVSTRVGLGAGISGGGANFRYNQFLTNGVPERSLGGAQPPEFAAGRTLPFVAVAEYEVQLAPFDVRLGDFTGATVNAITRHGTNRLAGEIFAHYRDEGLARPRGDTAYMRTMAGLALGGPLVRDRLHVFGAFEAQRLDTPMPGGGASLPVRAEDLARLDTLLRSRGLVAGDARAVANRNPLANVFVRLDAAFPGAGRLVVWGSEATSENLAFVRGARDTSLSLSSQVTASGVRVRTVALHLQGQPGPFGARHELLLSRRDTRAADDPQVRQPIVSVRVPAASGVGTVTVLTGTPAQAQSSGMRQRNIDVREVLSLPVDDAHLFSVGGEFEWFRVDPGAPANRYGTWSFANLDSLATGAAERFELARDLGDASRPLTGTQFGLFAGDRWAPQDGLVVTAGVRLDRLVLDGHPPRNALVDTIFGSRTDQFAAPPAEISPRLGVTWRPWRARRDRVRGGVGVFTGRPPLAWFHTPLRNYGGGTGLLRCGSRPQDAGPAPAFAPDPFAPPTSCAGGGPGTSTGDVELLAHGLRLPRALRGVVAWDLALGLHTDVTFEALVTRQPQDLAFSNRNLVGPQDVDIRGRVLYGAIDTNGVAVPTAPAPWLPSVIELGNTDATRAVQLTVRAERRIGTRGAASAAYTWSRVRDAQTPLRVNTRGLLNWASRAVSGRHDPMDAGISLNDVPHRVVVAGDWTTAYARWSTDVALLYVGEAGSPFTYRAWGVRGLGDLNADGSNANDPIYVPRDARQPLEIQFTGRSGVPGADESAGAQAARVSAQQTAFEAFIAGSACLRRARGGILARNACREPWTHQLSLAVRQRMPVLGRGAELQLDVVNVLNLLSGHWGQRRVAAPTLLEHVGQTTDTGGRSVPLFRFRTGVPRWTEVPSESSYQLQLGLRYSF